MTDWFPTALRFCLYSDLTLLFGISAFGLYVNGPNGANGLGRPQVSGRLLFVLAVAGIALSLFNLVQSTAAMSGVAMGHVDRETLRFVIEETSVGVAMIARILALAIGSLLVWRHLVVTGASLWGVTALASFALGSLAWTGHGAMNEGGAGLLHLGTDIFHLLAAGGWIGALFMLLRLAIGAGRESVDHVHAAHAALAGFSRAGTALVGTIILTGLVNGWMIVGPDNWRALPTSLYGQLLLAKLLLFIAMLGLASVNRFRLTPGLERAIAAGNWGQAGRALRTSILVESGCAILILAIVASLGMLEPPA